MPRPNISATRERLDAIAWATIDARAPHPGPPGGLARGGRACTFAELEEAVRGGQDYGFAESHFLDEMYLYRQASFFAQPPSHFLSPQRRAYLAAMAEYFSVRFRLPLPEWVHEPQYTLHPEWDWIESWEWCPAELLEPPHVGRRRARADATFLEHGIIFEVRNLIRL
jgi:hypothetical protein